MYDRLISIVMEWQTHSPFLFAVTVIVVMAVEGLLLGVLADFVFRTIGIRVKKFNP